MLIGDLLLPEEQSKVSHSDGRTHKLSVVLPDIPTSTEGSRRNANQCFCTTPITSCRPILPPESGADFANSCSGTYSSSCSSCVAIPNAEHGSCLCARSLYRLI